MKRFFAEPVRDYVAAVESIRDSGIAGLAFAAVALVATWFIYVPIHELMHAWGCIAAGGTVTRLDIAPEYGGALLAKIFPYVRSGSEYAGQLSGFDTHGSDAVYLVTVLAPYLLTIFAGVPLMKWVGRQERVRPRLDRPSSSRAIKPWLLGAAAILAYAPAISLMGDYYEAGSIVVSRIAHTIDSSIPLERWRSDDLPKLIGTLNASGAGINDWLGVALSCVTGVLLALLTYRIGAIVARLIMSRSSTRG